MNYRDAVHHLYALGNEVSTAKLGLDRVRLLLRQLGDPQSACRYVHVAGTNGKGSVSAMIEAGLRAAGVRTGLYTSPHLVEPTERIRIAGAPIGEDEFAGAFTEVHDAAARMMAAGDLDLHPTYFECVTAMAFLLFRARGVKIAVMEVGLGGRLDATNVIAPDLCAIAAIDYDHQNFLGDRIEQIAGEKAGILKAAVPAVFARQTMTAMDVLLKRAAELGIAFERADAASVSSVEIGATGSAFLLDGERIVCPLAGEHQVDNAIVAGLALRRLGYPPGGIATARWPGRLERVATNPDIILDGAHNPAGARALAAYLRRIDAGRTVHLIYGVMRDKPVHEMTAELFPLAASIVVTAPDNTRAMPPDELIRQAAPHAQISPADNIAAALEAVRARARADEVIVITGSLFLVGEARALLVE
ncbi:MAG TPA: folylpolyglutamate synthase/dihydrofolate synthase family protein [Bryobacteraceae bacterium]|nr:folylpolyglutamate synthase/dihydrofolate synthase family protein [Bryobacteraceae bacterium]